MKEKTITGSVKSLAPSSSQGRSGGAGRQASTAKRRGHHALHSERRRSINWIQAFQMVILVTAITVGSWFLLTNQRFNIRQIHIDGLQSVAVARIAAAAEVPRNSNIFLFVVQHRQQFCARIKACDPAIRSASVAVDFPNALRLHIVERQPFSVLRLANGESYTMDGSRITYRRVALNQSDLPIIIVPASLNTPVNGEKLPNDIDGHVAAAYSLLSLLAQRQIGPLADVDELFVDQYDNVSMRLHDQLLIKLGQSDGMPERLAAVETALDADPSLPAKAQYLDFTTSRPAMMQRPTPSAVLPGPGQPIGQQVLLKSP